MSNHSVINDLLVSLPDKSVPVRSVLVGAHWIAVWQSIRSASSVQWLVL
ncbi:MAG: hypothetical protein Q7V05_15365 [Methanoregula sp.]|nr:hypothetical protein [Methanoregula sp.]MDP2797374.1 hypothetical protein [Methanoregula sp.]